MKKNKIITILLCIIAYVVPLIRCPRSINNIKLNLYTNVPKAIVLGICGIILLILFLLKFKDKTKEFKFDTNDKLIFIFWCITGISTIFAYNTKKAIFGWGNRYTGFISTTIFILIYYCTKYYFEYFKSFFKWLFLIAACICVYSFMQYFDFMPIHKLLNIGYIKNFAAGTLGNTNFFGSFVTLFIPAAIMLYLYTKEKKYLAYASIYFGAMICSNTRSAWIAFIIYLFIIFIYILKEKNKDYLKRLGILILSFTIVFTILLTQNSSLKKRIKTIIRDFTSIGNNQNPIASTKGTTRNNQTLENSSSILYENNSSNNVTTYTDPLGVNITLGSGRLYIWTMALISIIHHPLLGAGPACSYFSYVDTEPAAIQYFKTYMKGIPMDVHNEFLDIAASIGIPGFCIYILFLTTIICQAAFTGFKKNNKVYLIIFLCILGYSIQAFFNIAVIGVAPLFWMLLGLSENKNAINNINKQL